MIMNGNANTAADQNESVPLDVWQRLYATAAKVREMEPWLWMEETDIFGVQDADNEEVAFVSIMGLLGEYHAVALYLGAKAVTQFWQMQNATGKESVADMLFDIRQIHAAFGKKSELEPQEKRIAQALGLNFKGANAWPYFRSYRPGYFPWMIDAREARLLILALEQILDVAPRVKEDRRLVARKPDTCTYLIRTPIQTGETRVWRDERRECPPPATTFQIQIPNHLMNTFRAMTPSGLTIELDVTPSYMPIGKKGERPQTPYMMLAVDSASGFIFGIELLTVEGALEDMWAQIPAKFLEMCAKHKMRPAKIAICAPWLPMVMQAMCKELGIEIIFTPHLTALTQARKEMDRFNRR